MLKYHFRTCQWWVPRVGCGASSRSAICGVLRWKNSGASLILWNTMSPASGRGCPRLGTNLLHLSGMNSSPVPPVGAISSSTLSKNRRSRNP